ncbi:MAG: putative toxin-antitoxin system toxin component, PIN family [Acidimicrobiales bacterium]
MRAVVDPGVLVSAALSPSGTPAKLIEAVRAGQLDLVVSALLVAELDDVLGRERVGARLDAGALGRLRWVLAEAPLVEDPAAEAVSRDPTDDYLIALARASASDCIFSGDKDLVSLVGLKPPVLTPTQALSRLRSEHPA